MYGYVVMVRICVWWEFSRCWERKKKQDERRYLYEVNGMREDEELNPEFGDVGSASSALLAFFRI